LNGLFGEMLEFDVGSVAFGGDFAGIFVVL
jgi:hypothetical protein